MDGILLQIIWKFRLELWSSQEADVNVLSIKLSAKPHGVRSKKNYRNFSFALSL
jgi:hypothetical protein